MQADAASGTDHQATADAKGRVDAQTLSFASRHWRFLRTLRTPAFRLLARHLRPRAASLVALSVLNLVATALEALRLLVLLVVLGMLVGETAVRNGTVNLAGFNLPVPFVNDLSGTRGLAVGVTALTLLTILKETATFSSNYLAMKVQAALTYDLRRALMDKLLALELGYFATTRAGDVSYLQNTVVNRVAGFLPIAQNVIATTLDLMVAIAMLLFISTRLTFVLAGLSIVLFYFVGRMRTKTARLSYEAEIASRDASTYYLDAVHGIRLVKLAGRDGGTRTEYLRRAHDLVRRTLKQMAFQELSQALTRTGGIAVLLIAAFGLYAVARAEPTATAGIGLGFVYVAYRAVTDLSNIAGGRLRLSAIVPQYMMVADFLLDERNDERRVEHGAQVDAVDSLVLDDVHFSYEPGRSVLDGVSLDFRAGTMTALVGVSGSGKTTILELAAGFRTPNQGRVVVDDVDLAEIDLDAYRRRIGYASQETVIFHSSLLENLRFLNPRASREEIEAAIDLACARDFVGGGPAGLEEVVGERGLRLSGGQRQRLALARVLAQSPAVLLLDEATNALDLATESRIYANVRRLCDEQGLIVVAAAHRLSALAEFDQIVVLHEGRILESGTHDDLMAKDGIYYHLYRVQQYAPQRDFRELE